MILLTPMKKILRVVVKVTTENYANQGEEF